MSPNLGELQFKKEYKDISNPNHLARGQRSLCKQRDLCKQIEAWIHFISFLWPTFVTQNTEQHHKA